MFCLDWSGLCRRETVLNDDTEQLLEEGMAVNNWKVIEMVGSGSFGQVYKVEKAKEIGALKCDTASHGRTLIESMILQFAAKNNLSHTLRFIESGRFNNRDFFIMELIDRGMDRVVQINKRRKTNKEKLIDTALRVGIQALKGLCELHSIGILHRDLKVENMGLDRETKKVVLLLDFNISRFFTYPTGQLKLPRALPGQKGTVLFMSFIAETGREAGRVDDLWGWFYIICEMINEALPWDIINAETERLVCFKLKTPLFAAHQLISNGPEELHSVMFHLETLNFESCPNYLWICEQLDKALSRIKADPTEPICNENTNKKQNMENTSSLSITRS